MEVVATAGHVDHGKSALVRALTGQEPDRLAEERRRGLTIDLGYVWTDLHADGQTITVAFVDVPGHDRFLTNMLAGVGPVDDVMFVVAADDGWSAQSTEHLDIVTVLGRRIVVGVVTKATPAGPSRTRQVVADLRSRLDRAGASDAPVVAVDALDGHGLDELRAHLVERLAVRTSAEGAADVQRTAAVVPAGVETRFPRLWVDRVFSMTGAGTVVTGTLASGRLLRHDRVAILPGRARGRARELRSLGSPVEEATAPARVAVALAGVDTDEVERGAALVGVCSGGTPTGLVSDALDVWLEVLPHATVERRGAWQVHLGSARRDARVLPLLGALAPGESGPVRIELDRPVAARIGDRLVLREVGQRVTAAGGTILEVAPARARRGVTERLVHAEALEAVHQVRSIVARRRAVVSLRGGVTELASVEAAFGEPVDIRVDDDGLVTLDGLLVERQRLGAWQAASVGAARERAGADVVVTHDQLAGVVVADGCPSDLAPSMVRAAIVSGELADVGGRVVHRDHLDAYQAGRRARQEHLLAALTGPGLVVLDLDRAIEESGLARFELQPLLDAGQVVKHDGMLFAPATVEHAVELLDTGPAADGGSFTASDARQVWGLSRRGAVPLLEHLRATGRTTFDGMHHRRVVDAGHAR